MTRDENTYDDEWENRQLCSDGNCIGVIGPDGRCKECGKPAGDEGGPTDNPVGINADPPGERTDRQADAPADEGEGDAGEETVDESGADDWAGRRLCPDGNCIGVIGPDGKCKECGRPAE